VHVINICLCHSSLQQLLLPFSGQILYGSLAQPRLCVQPLPLSAAGSAICRQATCGIYSTTLLAAFSVILSATNLVVDKDEKKKKKKKKKKAEEEAQCHCLLSQPPVPSSWPRLFSAVPSLWPLTLPLLLPFLHASRLPPFSWPFLLCNYVLNLGYNSGVK